jgi:hypothetical protein
MSLKCVLGENTEIMQQDIPWKLLEKHFAHDAAHPFIIHAGKTTTRVVGTKFNIRSYLAENLVTLTVTEGKVSFGSSPTTSALFTRGQTGAFDLRTGSLQKTESKNPNFLAWKTREFYFENMPLDSVLQKILFIILLLYSLSANCQTVKYSTLWFGPNANPVPEFTDGAIPEKTTVSFMSDYYVGKKDQTTNGFFRAEIPLLPKYVSLKVWSAFLENTVPGEDLTKSNGDIYVQTRILLFREKKLMPNIILNSTLKTASGTNFENKRYFDTPGYYFDLEFGKSFILTSNLLNEIRVVGNLGFMCWETSGSKQDDAPMYGIKMILAHKRLKLDNTLSGYCGWMHTSKEYGEDYGDAPLVFATKLSYQQKNAAYFIQYQKGILDFPYNQIRLGVTLSLSMLTPKYSK